MYSSLSVLSLTSDQAKVSELEETLRLRDARIESLQTEIAALRREIDDLNMRLRSASEASAAQKVSLSPSLLAYSFYLLYGVLSSLLVGSRRDCRPDAGGASAAHTYAYAIVHSRNCIPSLACAEQEEEEERKYAERRRKHEDALRRLREEEEEVLSLHPSLPPSSMVV
jgi:septal ring factor EnvC (AmiA/AmiB activator)